MRGERSAKGEMKAGPEVVRDLGRLDSHYERVSASSQHKAGPGGPAKCIESV